MNKTQTSDVIRLSVIDDHPIIFFGIRFAIRKMKVQSIQLVNQYICGADVISNLKNLNSDVCLIDMCLPDIKGYELAKKILEVYPDMKIGIYSNMLDREYILNSFKAGVLGYLSKTSGTDEIIDFIQTIGKGERYIRGVVADLMFSNEYLTENPKISKISKREAEILQLILDGYKNREIAEKLCIAERTVEFHKQNIYLKLDVNNSVDLYKAAMRLNLLSFKDSFST
jgi:DNA-binding NarL/FixJ family response regulator